jgi:PAS domain-containing protein
VDSTVPGQAQAAPDGRPDLADDPGSGLVAADDLPDGLIVADAGGCVTVFNRAARRLTGILPARALGQDVRHILPLQDADGRNWWAHVRRPLAGRIGQRPGGRDLRRPGRQLNERLGHVRQVFKQQRVIRVRGHRPGRVVRERAGVVGLRPGRVRGDRPGRRRHIHRRTGRPRRTRQRRG